MATSTVAAVPPRCTARAATAPHGASGLAHNCQLGNVSFDHVAHRAPWHTAAVKFALAFATRPPAVPAHAWFTALARACAATATARAVGVGEVDAEHGDELATHQPAGARSSARREAADLEHPNVWPATGPRRVGRQVRRRVQLTLVLGNCGPTSSDTRYMWKSQRARTSAGVSERRAVRARAPSRRRCSSRAARRRRPRRAPPSTPRCCARAAAVDLRPRADRARERDVLLDARPRSPASQHQQLLAYHRAARARPRPRRARPGREARAVHDRRAARVVERAVHARAARLPAVVAEPRVPRGEQARRVEDGELARDDVLRDVEPERVPRAPPARRGGRESVVSRERARDCEEAQHVPHLRSTRRASVPRLSSSLDQSRGGTQARGFQI